MSIVNLSGKSYSGLGGIFLPLGASLGYFVFRRAEAKSHYEMPKSVAFNLPCRLYIAAIIRGDDVKYQA